MLNVFAATALADFERRLNYQGRLVDTNGVPVPDDAAASIEFDICTNGSSTANCNSSTVWTETNTVAIVDGLFSAVLGGTTALSTVNFNASAYYIQITYDGDTYTPTQRITAAAMALNVPDASITSAKIANYTITSLDIQDGAVLDEISDNDGTGSGLDCDLLDGFDWSNVPAGTDIWVNEAGDTMSGTLNSQDIIPNTNNTYDLGSAANKWAELHITQGGYTDSSVTSADILNGTIGSADIANGAVASIDIADGAVASVDIADGAVASIDIADGSVAQVDVSFDFISSLDGVYNTGGNVDLIASTGIQITPSDAANTITFAASGSGIDHGLLTGLGDNDHPQYVLDAGDTMTGTLVMGGGADITFNNTGGVISNSAGNTIVNDILEVKNNLIVGSSVGTDDDSIYFDDGVTERIYWENANTRFRFTDDVYFPNTGYFASTLTGGTVRSNSHLYCNTNGGEADCYVYFYDGSSNTDEYLRWENTNDRFRFSNDLYVYGTITASGGMDHGSLTGLGDDDHPQYVLDAGDTMSGNLTMGGGADIVFNNTGGNISNSAGDTTVNDTLAVSDNLRIGQNSNADNDYAYFDASGEYLMWDNANTRFRFSDELVVDDDLRIGNNSGSDDDYIRFDAGGQYLRWENTNDRFRFSNDLYVTGNIYDDGTNLNDKFVDEAGDTMHGNLIMDNNIGIYFTGSSLGTDAARIYTTSTSDRLMVRAVDTDNVAQFAEYGLYLPQDTGVSLFTGGDILVGYAASDDNDSIYFDGSAQTERLYWENANTWFRFSDYLVVDDDLRVGNNSGSDNDYVYFDVAAEYLRWENSNTRFRLSDDVYTANTSRADGGFFINAVAGGSSAPTAVYEYCTRISWTQTCATTEGIVQTECPNYYYAVVWSAGGTNNGDINVDDNPTCKTAGYLYCCRGAW